MTEHDALITVLGILPISALLVAVLAAAILRDRAAAWAQGRLDQWKERHGE